MASGTHTVQARATDNFGATRTTDANTITVTTTPALLSITRKYTYNDAQELCRVVEREIGNTLGEREGATLMGYDAAGNLWWSASGLSKDTACSSDGNIAAINDRKAVRTYDARNRIATLTFPDANGNQSWTYTPDGLPASVTTYNDAGASSVVNSYAYNKRRLLVGESQASGSNTWTVGYGYDGNASLSTLVYPDGQIVAYAPNALGQPTQAGTYATNVTYYPNGAIAGFTYGNGVVHTLTQNDRGLPERSQDMDGSTAIHDDSYDYDAVGNVLAISDAVTGNRGNRDMVYDDLNRLTSATSPMFGTASYSYDAADNLRHVAISGGSQPRDQDYCYDEHWRLTNVKTGGCDGGTTVVGLGYDAQGNLNNRNGLLQFAFDYGNRMRTGGPEAYAYDVQGRRIRSSSSAGAIYSLYAQSGQLLYQRDERSSKRRQYIYLGGSLVAESDLPLTGSTATVTYQHTDALGSPVVTTDSGRNPGPRREYEPYGYQMLPTTLEDGPGYTGHVTDAATGLVYMQQRYYDPLCGCFLSVDPATAYSPGGAFNQYWYAAANPYGLVDPDGRDPGDPPISNYECPECSRPPQTTPPPPPPPPPPSTTSPPPPRTFADIISDAIEALANSTKENLHLQAEAQAAYGSGGKVEGETNLNGELGATAATSKGYGVDVAARFSGSPFKSAKPVQGAYTALTASGGAPISVSFTFAVDANRNWELTTAVGTGASLFIGTEIGYKYSQNP